MNTWQKLRDGTWGIRVQGPATPGESVWVEKRNGTRQNVVVDRIVWTDGTVSLCAVDKKASSPRPRKSDPAPVQRSVDQDYVEAQEELQDSSSCMDIF